jgi:hypothetical protein
MLHTMKTLEAGIQAIFPHVKAMRITPAMELGAIPEWDASAAAVLRAFIALRFGVDLPGAYLDEATTVGEILAFLRGGATPGISSPPAETHPAQKPGGWAPREETAPADPAPTQRK